jgi:hypothetical protein
MPFGCGDESRSEREEDEEGIVMRRCAWPSTGKRSRRVLVKQAAIGGRFFRDLRARYDSLEASVGGVRSVWT